MKTWLQHHRRALAHALRRLGTTPINTLFAILVVGITLALPAAGEMLMASMLAISRHATATPQISIFLSLEATAGDVAEIQGRLQRDSRVALSRFVPKDETLSRFRESKGLAEVIDALSLNPFPDAFIVLPRSDDPRELEALHGAATQWPKVEHVQLDSEWAKRLAALLRVGRLSVLMLAALLGVAIVAVCFNTIRLQILTQRAEIDVSRLLGATDGYIRRPYYYFGTLQGVLGGAAAWLIVYGAAALLRDPFAELAGLYDVNMALRPLPLPQSLALIGFAALLGWLGARLSVSRHLRSRERN